MSQQRAAEGSPARTTEDARRQRLQAGSLSAAFAAAADIHACEALLYGQAVPRHRLDQDVADQLGIPDGGSLTLDLDTVERILLLTPTPARLRLCERCHLRIAT